MCCGHGLYCSWYPVDEEVTFLTMANPEHPFRFRVPRCGRRVKSIFLRIDPVYNGVRCSPNEIKPKFIFTRGVCNNEFFYSLRIDLK